jgi:hypothetical protein
LTDIVNSNANTNRSGLEATNDNQASTTSATNVIRQGSKVLPTLDDPKKSNSDNRLNSKGNSVIDKERMIDIDTLNPYMNKFVCSCFFSIKNITYFRWTIKARVSNKSQIRAFTNARGPGKLFSCDLVDQSGEIRATGFNAECDKFHSMLEVGEVCFETFFIFCLKNTFILFRFIISLKHH